MAKILKNDNESPEVDLKNLTVKLSGMGLDEEIEDMIPGKKKKGKKNADEEKAEEKDTSEEKEASDEETSDEPETETEEETEEKEDEPSDSEEAEEGLRGALGVDVDRVHMFDLRVLNRIILNGLLHDKRRAAILAYRSLLGRVNLHLAAALGADSRYQPASQIVFIAHFFSLPFEMPPIARRSPFLFPAVL